MLRSRSFSFYNNATVLLMATAETTSYKYFKDFYKRISADSNKKNLTSIWRNTWSWSIRPILSVSEWWSLHPKSDSQHFVKGFLFVSLQKRDICTRWHCRRSAAFELSFIRLVTLLCSKMNCFILWDFKIQNSELWTWTKLWANSSEVWTCTTQTLYLVIS